MIMDGRQDEECELERIDDAINRTEVRKGFSRLGVPSWNESNSRVSRAVHDLIARRRSMGDGALFDMGDQRRRKGGAYYTGTKGRDGRWDY